MGLNRECLGKQYKPQTFEVTAEHAKKYALSYNEDNPWFLDESREGGIIAPPLFGVVYSGPSVASAMFDQELNVNFAYLVHGEQDMYYLRVVKPGDKITSVSWVDKIEEKATGEILSVGVRSWNQKGEDILFSYYSFFIRDPQKKKEKKEGEKKESEIPEPEKTAKMKVKDDQSYVYADASGDHNPIHVDENFAKSVGFKSVILQGLCTMAFTSKAVIDSYADRDPSRLKRLKVRFSKPVYLGDELETRMWTVGEAGPRKVINYLTVNQDGVPVILNGVAEVVVP